MPTFNRHKPMDQIRAQCLAEGVELKEERHKAGDSDFVRLAGGGCWVMFNTVNGRFWGETPDGTKFTSEGKNHEGKPWFQALLAFFYTN